MRIVGGSLGGRVLRAPAGRRHAAHLGEGPRGDLQHPAGCRGHAGARRVRRARARSASKRFHAARRTRRSSTSQSRARSRPAANLHELGLEDRATVVAGDAVALAARHVPPAPWTLVFIDPPYRVGPGTRAALALPLDRSRPRRDDRHRARSPQRAPRDAGISATNGRASLRRHHGLVLQPVDRVHMTKSTTIAVYPGHVRSDHERPPRHPRARARACSTT